MATQTSLGAQTVVAAAGGVVPCPGGDCDMGGLRATSTATDPSGPPGVGDAEGVVLSGTREELFVFGGFEGFRPRAAAWTFRNARWQRHGLPSGSRPGDVLAGAYHQESARYFEVDRLLLQARLRRWDPLAARFTTLGRWPSVWHPLARHWLVPGRDGDLYFVATRPASTAIARLRVEPSTGEVELAGIEFLEREVIGKPLGVEGGVLVVRQPALGTGSAGPARELLAAARFTARPAAWCPVAGGS